MLKMEAVIRKPIRLPDLIPDVSGRSRPIDVVAEDEPLSGTSIVKKYLVIPYTTIDNIFYGIDLSPYAGPLGFGKEGMHWAALHILGHGLLRRDLPGNTVTVKSYKVGDKAKREAVRSRPEGEGSSLEFSFRIEVVPHEWILQEGQEHNVVPESWEIPNGLLWKCPVDWTVPTHFEGKIENGTLYGFALLRVGYDFVVLNRPKVKIGVDTASPRLSDPAAVDAERNALKTDLENALRITVPVNEGTRKRLNALASKLGIDNEYNLTEDFSKFASFSGAKAAEKLLGILEGARSLEELAKAIEVAWLTVTQCHGSQSELTGSGLTAAAALIRYDNVEAAYREISGTIMDYRYEPRLLQVILEGRSRGYKVF